MRLQSQEKALTLTGNAQDIIQLFIEEKDSLNCTLNIQDFTSELRTHFTNYKRAA